MHQLFAISAGAAMKPKQEEVGENKRHGEWWGEQTELRGTLGGADFGRWQLLPSPLTPGVFSSSLLALTLCLRPYLSRPPAPLASPPGSRVGNSSSAPILQAS